jgi:hypothetical protein
MNSLELNEKASQRFPPVFLDGLMFLLFYSFVSSFIFSWCERTRTQWGDGWTMSVMISYLDSLLLYLYRIQVVLPVPVIVLYCRYTTVPVLILRDDYRSWYLKLTPTYATLIMMTNIR